MGNNMLIQIVASESSPEKEAEYNKWYMDKHIPMLFGYKGMKQVSRYQRISDNEECAKYLVLYEFESKEAMDAFHKSPEFAAAIEDFENMREKVDFSLKWASAYELIRSWER